MIDLFLIFTQTDTVYHTDRVYLFEIQRKRKNIINILEGEHMRYYLFFLSSAIFSIDRQLFLFSEAFLTLI